MKEPEPDDLLPEYDFSDGVRGKYTPSAAPRHRNPTMQGHFDRITFEPGKMGGRACIRSLRVTVSLIVGLVAQGASFEQILADYPYLEREDIQQALEYAAWLAREEIHTVAG